MTRIRRRLAAVAVSWLCSQAGLLTGAAIVLVTAPDAACTCAEVGGVICPMHHKRPLGSARCAIQSSTTTDAATPAIWFGTPGLIARTIVAIASAPVRDALRPRVLIPSGSSPSPDPRPPRA